MDVAVHCLSNILSHGVNRISADHIGQFWTILAGTRNFFFFLSFVIFEFLLEQNDNLFTLTY